MDQVLTIPIQTLGILVLVVYIIGLITAMFILTPSYR
jgi:hypothetical protein